MEHNSITALWYSAIYHDIKSAFETKYYIQKIDANDKRIITDNADCSLLKLIR